MLVVVIQKISWLENSRHRAGDAIPPRVVQFVERGGEFACRSLHRQFVAADFADLHRRNAHELGAFDDFHGVERFATDDDARLRFAEEQGVQTERRPLTPSLSPAGGKGVRRTGEGDAQIYRSSNKSWCFAGDELADAAFGERDGEAAFAAIVRAFHEAGLNQADERGMQRLRDFEVAARR